MKSRTDFVSIGWMDQLRQAMYNQIKAMGALLWVLLGFTVGLGNMMMEISPLAQPCVRQHPFVICLRRRWAVRRAACC